MLNSRECHTVQSPAPDDNHCCCCCICWCRCLSLFLFLSFSLTLINSIACHFSSQLKQHWAVCLSSCWVLYSLSSEHCQSSLTAPALPSTLSDSLSLTLFSTHFFLALVTELQQQPPPPPPPHRIATDQHQRKRKCWMFVQCTAVASSLSNINSFNFNSKHTVDHFLLFSH